jgi:hypothetical protein
MHGIAPFLPMFVTAARHNAAPGIGSAAHLRVFESLQTLRFELFNRAGLLLYPA